MRRSAIRGRRRAPAPFLPAEPRLASHPPLYLRPSDASVDQSIDLEEWIVGSRIVLGGRPEMTHVGEAFHAFAAVDEFGGSVVRRFRTGSSRDGGSKRTFSGLDLVLAANRLWSFLDERFSAWTWRREVPVTSSVGRQIVSGRMDLVGERGQRFVVVDHKAFPGRECAAASPCVRDGSARALC